MLRGDVKIHGWVYKFETGQVFSYEPQHMQYRSIEEAFPNPEPVNTRLAAI
jgi:carbonic anhydrase